MPELERIQPFGPGTQEYDIRDNTKLPVSGGIITGNLEIEGDLTLDSPLPIESGGTGSMTAAQALATLGAAAASHIHAAGDITSGTIPVSRGGTGASDAATARTNLGAAAANHDHNSILSPFPVTNRATTADQNPGDCRLQFFHATSSMATNKPPDGDGHILHFAWDNNSPNWANQLYIKNGPNAHMMLRGRNESSWGSWKRIYTEDDVVPVADGGTGATDAATARTNLGAAAASHIHAAGDITSGTIPVSRGGTGASDAVTARANLGAAAASHYHTTLIDLNGPDGLANGTRPTSADQNPGNSTLTHFLATSSMTTSKPPDGDGHILHMGWDNSAPAWHTQLYLAAKADLTAHMMMRTRSGSAWGAWKRIYTEDDVVPIADGGTGKTTAAEALAALGGISKKLLWTNSAPASAMAGQTISISNMSTYQEFEVYFMLSTGTQYAESRHYIYNVQGRVTMNEGYSVYTRDIKPISTGLQITTGTSSSYVIPYKIYGIKGVT